MIGTSKILTVSYGTFSCTLEGFEDSFATMKAISEYFRDLAADDRYFGAEPPTPDAEMLARIAEREISRRVEARTRDNGTGIILKAETDETPQPLPTIEESPAPTDVDTAPARVAADVAAESLTETVARSVKTETQAEEAPVAPAMPPVATPPVDVAPMASPSAVEHPATSARVADVPAEETAETNDEGPEVVSDDAQLAAALLDKAKDTRDNLAPSEPVVSEQAPKPAPAVDLRQVDAESVAAKLQRIRAVVNKDTGTDATAYVEDQHAQDELTSVAEEQPQVSADDATDTEAQAAEDAAAQIKSSVTKVAAQDYLKGEDENPVDKTAETTPETEEQPAPKKPVRARIIRMRKGDAPVTMKDAEPVAEEETAAPDQQALDDSLIASIFAESELTDEDALEATDTVEAAKDPDMLSAEDEAELLKALEGIEDEDEGLADANAPSQDALADEETASDDVDDNAPVKGPAEDVAKEAPKPLRRNRLPENNDEAMSRIMSQTDEVLSDPEGNRRRDAITQLKAAVVATEAARQLGDDDTTQEEDENTFRDDLNDAVRPKRPNRPTRPEGASTSRPRPAPLKLVASQRVNAPEDAATPDTPVQPRRVARKPDVVDAGNAASFAEFASEMGATELPDLLEAAAAYTSFVEGAEDFSRPQIMEKVKLSSAQDFSREDGLRSFGTLLRQGRISKTRNGRFQVSEQTRFRPEQRAG